MQATYPEKYIQYRNFIEQHIDTFLVVQPPAVLYEPIRYSLLNGGKRVRPILTMLCSEAVGGRAEQALNCALAVELLHNFTLVHDDIMDAAAMRRNLPTVHTKWNQDTAILAGDTMIALAHKAILASQLPRLREIMAACTTGIIEVCEGQAYDLEFQSRDTVSHEEYVLMIEKKTAKMLECAAVMGALAGEGQSEQIEALRQYANALGIAFQIQDDLLDATADHADFGKTVGGDIIEGKKTYLIVRAFETVREEEDRILLRRFREEKGLPESDIHLMQDLFRRNGILDEAQTEVERLIAQAHAALSALPDNDASAMLHWFADMLMARQH